METMLCDECEELKSVEEGYIEGDYFCCVDCLIEEPQ